MQINFTQQEAEYIKPKVVFYLKKTKEDFEDYKDNLDYQALLEDFYGVNGLSQFLVFLEKVNSESQ